MITGIVLTVILFTAVYFLYNNGIGGVNMMFSLMNMTSMDCKRSRFSCSTGYMKRVAHFKEDRVYHFTLDLSLTKGDFWIELLDSRQTPILKLDQNNKTASAEMSSNERYHLVFHFKSASGKYTLSWS